MVFVFLLIFMASLILEISSFIITTSLASIAALLPFNPMEIPIVLRASVGASFIPSPTKETTSPSFINSLTFSYLS